MSGDNTQNEILDELAETIGFFRDIHASRDLIKAFKIDFTKPQYCERDRRKTWQLHFSENNDEMTFTFLEPNGDKQSIQEIILTSDTITLHEVNHANPKGRRIVITQDGTDDVIEDSMGCQSHAELAKFLESFQIALERSHRAVANCILRAETAYLAKSLLTEGYFKRPTREEEPQVSAETKKQRCKY